MRRSVSVLLAAAIAVTGSAAIFVPAQAAMISPAVMADAFPAANVEVVRHRGVSHRARNWDHRWDNNRRWSRGRDWDDRRRYRRYRDRDDDNIGLGIAASQPVHSEARSAAAIMFMLLARRNTIPTIHAPARIWDTTGIGIPAACRNSGRRIKSPVAERGGEHRTVKPARRTPVCRIRVAPDRTGPPPPSSGRIGFLNGR